jgi:hypothetical protein
MKKQENKSVSMSARILAGVLCAILLAGTVLGVLIYLL